VGDVLAGEAAAFGKPRAIYDSGLTSQKWGEHQLVVGRILLQVRILDNHEFAGNRSEASPKCGTLASVLPVRVDVYPRVSKVRQHLRGAIDRAIIDHKYFMDTWLVENSNYAFRDVIHFVEARDHHR